MNEISDQLSHLLTIFRPLDPSTQVRCEDPLIKITTPGHWLNTWCLPSAKFIPFSWIIFHPTYRIEQWTKFDFDLSWAKHIAFVVPNLSPAILPKDTWAGASQTKATFVSLASHEGEHLEKKPASHFYFQIGICKLHYLIKEIEWSAMHRCCRRGRSCIQIWCNGPPAILHQSFWLERRAVSTCRRTWFCHRWGSCILFQWFRKSILHRCLGLSVRIPPLSSMVHLQCLQSPLGTD